MPMVDGGALVGKALANEGIEKAFVLCGGHIMPIFYGMAMQASRSLTCAMSVLPCMRLSPIPGLPARWPWW